MRRKVHEQRQREQRAQRGERGEWTDQGRWGKKKEAIPAEWESRYLKETRGG
jgi:hypothetical protein